MPRPGALVLVVGPSGAGKDTLMGAAKSALADDPAFVFARRVITRDAVAELEDHDTIDRAGFDAAKARGQFALTWEAHGLCYGIPSAIDDDIAEGRTVVMNGSRGMLEARSGGKSYSARRAAVSAGVSSRPSIMREKRL